MRVRVHLPARIDAPAGWDAPQRARAEEVIRRAIMRAAASLTADGVSVELARLPQPRDVHLTGRPASSAEAARERIDPARLRPSLDAYGIPSFDDGGAQTDVPAIGVTRGVHATVHTGVTSNEPQPLFEEGERDRLKLRLRDSNVDDRVRALGDVEILFQNGDLALQSSLFDLLLLAIQPDGSPPTDTALQLIEDFARRYPDHFIDLLRRYGTLSLQALGGVSRTETDFTLGSAAQTTLEQRREALDLAGAVTRVVQHLAAARRLAAEWERGTPGVGRVIGLVQALVEERTALLDYLHASSEPTDATLIERLRQATENLGRIAGLIAALATQAELGTIVRDLQADLVANIGWVAHTNARVREIDDLLGSYRTIYGDAADEQEEVTVLSGLRLDYLQSLAGEFLPTAQRVTAFQADQDTLFASWRADAATIKVDKLGRLLEAFQEAFRRIHETYGGASPDDLFFDFHARYLAVFEQISQLTTDVNELSHTAIDTGTLARVAEIEQSFPLLLVRLNILDVWLNSILLQQAMEEYGVRSEERAKWGKELDTLRAQLKKSFNEPNLEMFPEQLDEWIRDLEDAQFDSSLALREVIRKVGRPLAKEALKFVVASVLTEGVGTAFEASEFGWLVISLAEGFTFTVGTTAVGAAFGETPTLSGFAEGVVTNTIFIGALKSFGAVGAATADAIAPGRQLVRAVSILGAQAVGGTLARMTAGYIESGRLPEHLGNLFGAQLLLVAVFGQFERSLPATTDTSLVRAAPGGMDAGGWQRLVGELRSLGVEREQWLNEMDIVIERGGPTQAEFTASQERGIRFHRRLEEVLRQMRGPEFSDAALGSLGVTRQNLADFSEIAAHYADAIAAARYRPTEPLPGDLLGDRVVETAPGIFAYHPDTAGGQASDLMVILRRSGYAVVDQGGGVLSATGRLGSPVYRLLPAGPEPLPAWDSPNLTADQAVALYEQAQVKDPQYGRDNVRDLYRAGLRFDPVARRWKYPENAGIVREPIRPPLPEGAAAPRLAIGGRFRTFREAFHSQAATQEQERIIQLAASNPQQAGLEYEALVRQDLGAQDLPQIGRPGRRPDVGLTHEVTIEGRQNAFGTNKLNQFWLDFRDRGEVLLTVPRLSDAAMDQLRRLGAQAELPVSEGGLGKPIQIIVRETLP